MKLVCVINEVNTNSLARTDLLYKACQTRGVELILPDAATWDPVAPFALEAGSMLYRATRGDSARILEQQLITPNCATFYRDPALVFCDYRKNAHVQYEKAGLRSIHRITINENTTRHQLNQITELLGGFPIGIKVTGHSHGVGVIKADSMESLISMVDYLKTVPGTTFHLMEFFEHDRQARLIVVGNQVIASHENLPASGDFRTNAAENHERRRRLQTYSNDIHQLAVRAVQALGLEFGGVDVLLNSAGDYRLAEVNFPCYFPTTQEMTHIDVAGVMVDYLMHKARMLMSPLEDVTVQSVDKGGL